jgi:hypothetical protein
MSREIDWSTVEVIETTPAHLLKRAANATKPFAIVDLAKAAAAMKALEAPRAMVWIWIVHQTKKRGSPEITVSKGALARYGVSTKMKAKALAQLAEAGLIAVERKPGRATVVRLLKC